MAEKQKPPAGPEIKSWVGADEALRELRELNTAIASREAHKSAALREVQERFDNDILPLAQKRDMALAALEDFAEANRAEFADKRSRELNHGTLGFRMGQLALQTLKKVTWKDVLARLLGAKSLRVYVVTKSNVDKESILRDAKPGPDGKSVLNDAKLQRIGVQVVQEERFYVELKDEETVSPCAAVAAGSAA